MVQKLDFAIRAIEAIPSPSEGRSEFKDTKVPGLYLRVTATGVKTFSCVGRAKGASKPERVTLGRFPAVKPDQARARALAIAAEMASGTSPAAAARVLRGELTLDELAEEYRKHLKERGLDDFDSRYELYIGPAFGKRRLSEITARDVGRWHQTLPEKILQRRLAAEAERAAKAEERRREMAARQAIRRHGPIAKPKAAATSFSSVDVTGEVTSNRALRKLRAMFNWAQKPGNGYFTGTNPAAGHSQFPERSRSRFLMPYELGPFFDALAEEANLDARDAILTKLLTGARRENVHAMRWSDVDLENAEWHIPKTKNGTPQTVPLVPEAVALLQQRKTTSASVFVFPASKKSSKTGHIGNLKKAWDRVLQRSGLRDIRQHDLRRTLGSWQARTGASLVLIGKSLNHKHPASTAIYARLDTDPVRESVGRATSAMFEAAGLKAPAEVIPLHPHKTATR